MQNEFSRRDFIKHSGGILSAITLLGGSALAETPADPAQLPRRPLGRTGIQVSALAFGCGSFYQALPDGVWEPILERALQCGVNYFDEAAGYHFEKANPHSEVRLGRALKGRRHTVHICSKLDVRDPEKGKVELEEILTRLQTDYLDVLMVHDVRADETDPSIIEKGIYAQLRRWKEAGVARHVGFSSMMTDGPLFRRYIEVLNPDVVLAAISATKHGAIAENILPAAIERNCGVIAMKLLRDVVGKGAGARELLGYGWQKPGIHSLLVSHSNLRELEENVGSVCALAAGSVAVSAGAVEQRVAHLAALESLAWTRRDYFDRAGGIV